MTKFSKSKKDDKGQYTGDNFTFTVDGEKEVYINTIKALLSVLGSIENNLISVDERYLICNLISGMLPDDQQIANIEDIKELNTIQERRKKIISTIVENK